MLNFNQINGNNENKVVFFQHILFFILFSWKANKKGKVYKQSKTICTTFCT